MAFSLFCTNSFILVPESLLTLKYHSMKQRKFTASLLMAVAFLVVIPSFASIDATLPAKATTSTWAEPFKANPEIKALTPEMIQMGLEQFLTLTPSKYKELTGKKLGLKKSMELKAAQKFLKKKMGKASDVPKGLYIVLAILGWAWVVMGIMDDWTGNDWWVNLLLTILCWLPGVIHALVKMKKYYN
jgi:uncharacterized membrane protein YqaE (UPF0057 family)